MTQRHQVIYLKRMKKSSVVEAITLDESKRLIALEKTIQAGVDTFVSVGCALAEIKESKLYRADFETFEDYCHKKWQFTRIRAHQLIEAARVAKALPENVKQCLTNPRQASELAKAPKGKRASIVKGLVKESKKSGKPITAKKIREKVSVARGGLAAMGTSVVVESELPNPVIPEGIEVSEESPVEYLTVKEFERALFDLEMRVEKTAAGKQSEREKYGVVANGMANRLMNPQKNKSVASFYTS